MAKTLKKLREKLARLETGPLFSSGVSLGHADADGALHHGLLSGVLHEVFAAERHVAAGAGFALMLTLRLAREKYLLWVQQDFSATLCGELSPSGFLELGFDPNRLIVLHALTPVSALRAAKDALSCKSLGAVVLESWGDPKILDLVASRRLTLAAVRSGVPIVHLRLAARPCVSTAETRWLIEPEPSRHQDWGDPIFSAALLRNRHGRTGHFLMEWSCDERIFRTPANSRDVVADVTCRPSDAVHAETRLRQAG